MNLPARVSADPPMHLIMAMAIPEDADLRGLAIIGGSRCRETVPMLMRARDGT